MKTISLELPYKTKPDGMKAMPEVTQITVEVLTALVRVRYQGGMNGNDVGIWGEISDAMAEDGVTSIEIETSQFKWLYDVVRWSLDHSKVPPQVAPWVRVISEHLDEVKAHGEPKLEAVK